MTEFWLGFATGALGLLAGSAAVGLAMAPLMRFSRNDFAPDPEAQNDIHLTKINSTYVREFHHD